MITSKCPLRISLAGGSTDLQEFINVYGYGAVINFSTNVYTYASINEDLFGLSSRHLKYIVNYSSREEVEEVSDIKNDIVRECFKYFNIPPNTSSLTADIFSSGSGLASSSSYLISFIKAVTHKRKIRLNNKQVCKAALELERRFNPLTGYQDPYGCGTRGLKKIEIHKPDKVKVTPLPSSFLNQRNMYLCYTGVHRSSTETLEQVDIHKAQQLLPLVDQMEKTIHSNDYESFLKIISEGWLKKLESCPAVIAHPTLSELNSLLLKDQGILAHRLCGAGNGGFFLLFTSDEWSPTQNKLEKNCLKINICNKGAQVTKL